MVRVSCPNSKVEIQYLAMGTPLTLKIYSNGLSAEDEVDSATEDERTDRLDNMENCVMVEFVWKWASEVLSWS